MATCCDVTLYGKYNAWGTQPIAPTAPSILKTSTAIDLGCAVAVEEPPPVEREYIETFETFILTFDEFTQYDPIPELPAMLTSNVTGSNGTVIEFRFWGQNTELDGFSNNYFAAEDDFLSTYPGMGIVARAASTYYADHALTIEWDTNKDLLQPVFDPVRTVQFLDGARFIYSGLIRVRIQDTGEGYDHAYTQSPLVGWQQSNFMWVEDEFGTKLSNNRVRLEPGGLGIPAYAIGEFEIVIGTRTLI